MDTDHANRLAQAWDRASKSSDFPFNEVAFALERLPEPGTWAVSEDASAMFTLLPDTTLFTLTLRQDGRILTVRRPLNGRLIVVSLEQRPAVADPDGIGLRWDRHWSFRYQDEAEPVEAWQRVHGIVRTDNAHGETLDNRETFAQALASAAGWVINP